MHVSCTWYITFPNRLILKWVCLCVIFSRAFYILVQEKVNFSIPHTLLSVRSCFSFSINVLGKKCKLVKRMRPLREHEFYGEHEELAMQGMIWASVDSWATQYRCRQYLDTVALAPIFSVTVIWAAYIKTITSFPPCGYTRIYMEYWHTGSGFLLGTCLGTSLTSLPSHPQSCGEVLSVSSWGRCDMTSCWSVGMPRWNNVWALETQAFPF